MDLTKVEKDENTRQLLIIEQKSDGRYNEKTGVYIWGKTVYDLTKTGGEIGLGWMPIKGKIIAVKRC